MPYTYPLSLPTATGFAAIDVSFDNAVAVAESNWTGYQQVQRNQKQRWIFDVTLPIMTRAEAALWESFFLKLNGKEYTFLMGHPGEAAPRGVATGTPLVKGASQSGQALITDGWTINTTNILGAGSWVQLGTGSAARLYRNLDNTNSNASGEATLNLWPLISQANIPADNAALVITGAQGVFRLDDQTVPFKANSALHYNYRFKAVSVV